MRFLSRLLETKDSEASIRRASTTQLNYGAGQAGIPYRSSWDVERAVRDGLERVIWVYRAIDVIADNQSRLDVILRQGDPEEGKPVEDHPLLKLLNRRANSYETARQFRYRLSAQLLLSKQGSFVEVERDKGGNPTALHLLPPQFTSPIPDAKRFVSGYEVRVAGSEPEILDPDKVLWIKRPHPTDPYLSLIPMEAAGLSIDLDFYARLYNRTFMQNDGRPGGILSVKDLDEDAGRELSARFSGGSAAGRISILDAEAMSWVDLATSPRDAQYTQSRVTTKEEILMAFGTAETVLGNAAGRTFDNADAEFEVFWRVTMASHNDLISSTFDRLTSEDGEEDDLYLGFDTSGISVLQRDMRRRQEHDLAQFKDGAITLNTLLERWGEQEVDHPGARVHWLEPGRVPVGTEEDAEAALAATQPSPPPMEEIPVEEEEIEGEEEVEDVGEEIEPPEPGVEPAEEKALIGNTGAMVALLLPPAIERRAGPPDADLHVTLAYFGKAADLELAQVQAARTAVAGLARMNPPMRAWFQGHTDFGPSDDRVRVQLLDGPDLVPFRERVVQALSAAGLPVRHDHGFIPHVTGADAERDQPFLFDRLLLAVGDSRWEWRLDPAAPHVDERGNGSPAEGKSDWAATLNNWTVRREQSNGQDPLDGVLDSAR